MNAKQEKLVDQAIARVLSGINLSYCLNPDSKETGNMKSSNRIYYVLYISESSSKLPKSVEHLFAGTGLDQDQLIIISKKDHYECRYMDADSNAWFEARSMIRKRVKDTGLKVEFGVGSILEK